MDKEEKKYCGSCDKEFVTGSNECPECQASLYVWDYCRACGELGWCSSDGYCGCPDS